MEALRIYKCLQHKERETKALQPILLDPPPTQRQDPGAEIRVVMLREDQETRVVGYQIEPIKLMTIAPTNPPSAVMIPGIVAQNDFFSGMIEFSK